MQGLKIRQHYENVVQKVLYLTITVDDSDQSWPAYMAEKKEKG